ncbi:MAG: hypothetical protein HZR80_21060 [Candidatus Heimdallarchaeota archaeon]
MTKKTIAEHMRDIMVEENIQSIEYACSLFLDCFDRAKMKIPHPDHPLNRMHRVMNALDKSPLFEKKLLYYDVRARWVRVFFLKELVEKEKWSMKN